MTLYKIACDKLNDLHIKDIIDYKDDLLILSAEHKKNFNTNYYKYDCKSDSLNQLDEKEIKLYINENTR
jgi:hypothetical protein